MTSVTLSPPEHEHSAAIDEAANWLAKPTREQISLPIVPHIKQAFGLSTQEAVQAIREANIIRGKGGANATSQ